MIAPETPLDEASTDGISRRRVLKRIGGGVAIAWTAPVLTSLRTPALAQASPRCTTFDCTNSCPQPSDCPPPCTCGPFLTTSDECFCATDFPTTMTFRCRRDSDCPPLPGHLPGHCFRTTNCPTDSLCGYCKV
jgi:hypothetical protein